MQGWGRKLIGDIWPCLRDGERRPPHQEGENWQEGRKEGKFFAKHSGRLSQDRSKSKSQLPHEPDFLHLEGAHSGSAFKNASTLYVLTLPYTTLLTREALPPYAAK